MKWYSDSSQIAWACDALILGREISHTDEISEMCGWRLSAIIYNLRHRYHWPISTRYDGNNKKAYYRLQGSAEDLKKPRSYIKAKKEWDAVTSHSKPDSEKDQPDNN